MSFLDRFSKRIVHLDAFPKVQRNIQQATGSGGLLTVFVGLLLAYLAASEFAQYRAVNQEYEFLVDQARSMDHGLQINLDLTIAMPCDYLRADVLDVGGVSLPMSRELSSQAVTFQTKGTKRLIDVVGKDKLDIHKIVEKAGKKYREQNLDGNPENKGACRITGALRVDKVSGMLHFTAPGHGYSGGHTPHDIMNFTHRIDKLSFGQYYPGLHNPLDRTLETARSPMDMFQYFVAIVPTIYLDANRAFGKKVILTSQYAVTDYQRSLDPMHNQGGVPGVFIKYDIEPIMVRITESRMGILGFLTRFCGILGGIFVTVGIILDVFRWITSWFM
ncbi:endoplasmic reticulum vesicle transporter-domain-containing protein [Powellomyces hirtus]|nr:endoplasmic reticulum vesicle transporter-domain-containing protein [Powellomyces hirtus]